MIASPQAIRIDRGGIAAEAVISWRYERDGWTVELASAATGAVAAHAADAFEALCLVRERLEPEGWRVGVAGAQAGVWPSGMARDQGGGLTAYRLEAEAEAEAEADTVVDTFAPVDPATTSTVAAQQADAERAGLGRPTG